MYILCQTLLGTRETIVQKKKVIPPLRPAQALAKASPETRPKKAEGSLSSDLYWDLFPRQEDQLRIFVLTKDLL